MRSPQVPAATEQADDACGDVHGAVGIGEVVVEGQLAVDRAVRAQWIGKTFKELRQRNGMTLQEVGEYLRRDQSSLSRFESGVHPPRKDDVICVEAGPFFAEPQRFAVRDSTQPHLGYLSFPSAEWGALLTSACTDVL